MTPLFTFEPEAIAVVEAAESVNVESAEYVDYLKTNQDILFKIKEEFEKAGIDMAYPTQTIYIEKQG